MKIRRKCRTRFGRKENQQCKFIVKVREIGLIVAVFCYNFQAIDRLKIKAKEIHILLLISWCESILYI